MAPVYDFSWRTYPLGDFIESVQGILDVTGWTRAWKNWDRLRTLLATDLNGSKHAHTLSLAQKNSFRILCEWWDGGIQDESLSQAARVCIEETAGPAGAAGEHLDIDREKCLVRRSTYHEAMFFLFQLEFVNECRLLQLTNMEQYLGLLHAQREKCAQLASMQRVANSFIRKWASPKRPEIASTILRKLQNCIGATIEPCPWLKVHELEGRTPFYLWDVEGQCTVQVDQLPNPPDYVCVTHTWGRWRDKVNGPVKLKGVPWDVPRNTRWNVVDLPDQLSKAFTTGFVWLDLLCIPQDRSTRALIEISRQALIFSNASAVIAWLNDNDHGWNFLQNALKWLSLVYIEKSIAKEHVNCELPSLDDCYEELDEFIELMLTDSDASTGDEFKPLGWFTSLWTLQEACLRPDVALFDKDWIPLEVDKETIVTLDCLVALTNFVARGTYKNPVLRKKDVTSLVSESTTVPLATLYRTLRTAPVDEGEDENEDVEDPPDGTHDLMNLLNETFLDEVIWLSPAAVLTFGQYRQCRSRRSEAIMSVIGATDWFTKQLTEKGTVSPNENLVLGFYPANFLNEVAHKIGPSFYLAMHTDLSYLAEIIQLKKGHWQSLGAFKTVGSALPFTNTACNMVPPQKYEFGTYDHPSVDGWTILDDGKVEVRQAGYLTFGNEENVEKDNEDIVISPKVDDEGDALDQVEIAYQEDQDLEAWLNTYADPKSSPNYAVCLNQQIYLSRDIPGPQVGLLLKQVGQRDGTSLMVKVGSYFTRASRAWDVSTKAVDWLIL